METLVCLLCAAALAAPKIEVSTLDRTQHGGDLASLSAQELVITAAEAQQKVPVSELLEVRVIRDADPEAADTPALAVSLTDGSSLQCKNIAAVAQEAKLNSLGLGDFSLPLAAIANIRFAPLDAKLAAAWDELCQRELKRDLLVVRRDEVLDHLDGVVGNIDDKSVRFLHDGNEIRVSREKLFGVIYARTPAADKKAVCEATLAGNEVVQLKELAFDGDTLTARLLAGPKVSLAVDRLQSLDFSLGKVKFLSQMEPREVEYTPFFDHTWEYERDRTKDGGVLQLGKKSYSRGLWIHSKTRLKYRLAGEYRLFKATMGIDDLVARKGLGNVHVVINGDGKKLFEADVLGVEEPRPLELDVTNVRDLEIVVDFGGDLDIADHLDLADAKVIK